MTLPRAFILLFVLAMVPLWGIAIQRDLAARPDRIWSSLDLGKGADFQVVEGPLSPVDVVQSPAFDRAFQPAQAHPAALSMPFFSGKKLWLRFQMDDPGGDDPQVVLRIKDLRPREARLVLRLADGRVITRDWAFDDLRHRAGLEVTPVAFVLNREEVVGATAYLGWSSYGAVVAHVFVESRDAFVAAQMRASFWYGAMNGAIVAVGVYLLVIGWRMRETSMLWAAAFSIHLGLRNLGAVGVLHAVILPSFPALADVVLYGFQVVPVSFWLAFLVSWLELDRYHPRWSRVLLLTAALLPMQGVMIILRGGFGWNIPMNISAAFPVLFGIVVGVVFLSLRAFAGDRRARLYFLCWMPIALGTLARLLNYFLPDLELSLGPAHEPGLDMVVTVTAIAVLLTLTFRDREGRLRAVADQHERRIRDYATIAGQGVVELDSAGRVAHAIGPLAEQLGLVAGVAADRVLGQDRGLLMTPGTVEVERPEGWFALTISPMTADDRAGQGSRVIVTDVTEVVRARQTEGRRNTLAALGQLAGSVAHEVNNLLHPLINLTRWVQRTEPLSDAGQKYLDLVATSGTRAGEIVGQVLQGYSPHNLAAPKLPLAQALRDAVATVAVGLPATARLEVDLQDDAGPSVSPGEALQLLSNLVSNSLRAMKGVGTIWLQLAKGAGGLRLVLRDDGPGMAPEILARATEMFVTSGSDSRGVGIGLAIVAEIADNWGARLDIQSKPGFGCAVVFVWDGQGQEGGDEARSGGG